MGLIEIWLTMIVVIFLVIGLLLGLYAAIVYSDMMLLDDDMMEEM